MALRPVPLPRAPDLGLHLGILTELLQVQRERLLEARELERSRGFIFPETTVIARDVARLSAAVYGCGSGSAGVEREDDRPDDPEPTVYDADGPVDLEALVCEVTGDG